MKHHPSLPWESEIPKAEGKSSHPQPKPQCSRINAHIQFSYKEISGKAPSALCNQLLPITTSQLLFSNMYGPFQCHFGLWTRIYALHPIFSLLVLQMNHEKVEKGDYSFSSA